MVRKVQWRRMKPLVQPTTKDYGGIKQEVWHAIYRLKFSTSLFRFLVHVQHGRSQGYRLAEGEQVEELITEVNTLLANHEMPYRLGIVQEDGQQYVKLKRQKRKR